MQHLIFEAPKLWFEIHFSTKNDSIPPANNSFGKHNFHKS